MSKPSSPQSRAIRQQAESTLEEQLERCGWPARHRAEARRRLSEWFDDELIFTEALALFPALIEDLATTADPPMALVNFDRFARVVFHRGAFFSLLTVSAPLRSMLSRLFAYSQYFSDTLVRNPEYLDWCLSEGALDREKTGEEYERELRAFTRRLKDEETRRRALCRFKRRELLRLGVRELMGHGNIEEYCRELTGIAEAACSLAFEDCHRALIERHGTPSPCEGETERTKPGLAVYAMGKMGGHELNFSSDIDLIFIYDVEGETSGRVDSTGHVSGRISNHDFYVRHAREIVRYLSYPSSEGMIYRVDVRLRPEGKAGAMARSLTAYSTYFVQQARSWEKISYLKARIVAGDQTVMLRFREIREAFVFGTNDPAEILPEVARLKNRIDHENLDHRTRGLDIKRGPGGIREIEFITAVHQLLEGVYDRTLRMRSTVPALETLAERGKIKTETASKLAEAYWMMRRVEHVLQLYEDQQTHALPEGAEERRKLALRCGFPDRESFEEELEAHRTFVRKVFGEVFQQERVSARQELADQLESSEEPDEETLRKLEPFGLGTVQGFRALRELAVGTREIAISSSGQRNFERLLPALLKEIRNAARPEQAIGQLSNLMRAHHTITGVYDLVLAHPPILRLLIRTLGFGNLPPRLLVAHPEWLDELLETTALAANHSPREAFTVAFPDGLTKLGTEKALARLRVFKDREALFAAIREIIGIASAHAAARQTTELAEVCLQQLCGIIAREMNIGSGWSVMAFGSFGAREVHLCGDIDVAFFVEDAIEGANREQLHVFASRVLSEMSAVAPEAQLWKTDARLRPDGRNAPLVVTKERAERYYREEAGTWEFQSLTRARSVAGDTDFGQGVLDSLLDILRERIPGEGLAEEIRTMRLRLDESVRLPRRAHLDLKRSPGGLVDGEFLVQFHQLRMAKEQPEVLHPVLEDAVAALAKAGALNEKEARFVSEHDRLLRTVQRMHRLLNETARDYLTEEEGRRAELTRGLSAQLDQPAEALAALPGQMKQMRALFLENLARFEPSGS